MQNQDKMFTLLLFFTYKIVWIFSQTIYDLCIWFSFFYVFYFILFFFINLFNFILFSSHPHCKSFLLSSFFIMNCRISTNRKWNYKHVSVLPFIFVSCSLTIEDVGFHSFPLKKIHLFICLFTYSFIYLSIYLFI